METFEDRLSRDAAHIASIYNVSCHEFIFISVDAGKLAIDVAKANNIKLAPTNEVLSFRAYSAHRKLNRLRKSACRLFQSVEVIKVVQKLEAEVESKRLRVRKDKMMHADLGKVFMQ